MSKKKLLFGISVGLNILLVVIVVWGILKINLVENTVVHTEIQHNLVELEGLIAHQMDHNWSDPHLVTTKLENVYRGISLGMAIEEPLGMLAKSDKATLEDLYFNLEQYPRAELYRFVDLTEEDKKDFEDLRKALREVEIGMNISLGSDINIMMEKLDALNDKLEPSINE